MSDEIKVGDIVDIYFQNKNGQMSDCKVLYVPSATGDCWRFIDSYGDFRYVLNFEEIVKKDSSK